jgi:hypothetical protein
LQFPGFGADEAESVAAPAVNFTEFGVLAPEDSI